MKSQLNANEILGSLSGQVEQAEVYQVHSLSEPVSFRGGQLETVRRVAMAGRTLRLIRQGRLGFSTTTDMDHSATLVRNALATADFGQPVTFSFPASQPSAPVRCFDPQIEQLRPADLLAMVKEVIARIQPGNPDLQVNVTLNKAVHHVSLANTNGLQVEEQQTVLALSVGVVRAQEGDVFLLSRSVTACRLEDLDLFQVADRLVHNLAWGERVVAVESGRMPVVLCSEAAMVLWLPLLTGLNGGEVVAKTSPLSGRLGEQAFAPAFSLVDDARVDFWPRSAAYDDEGVPTATRALVEEGVVRHFLYDLKTAAAAGVPSTGNGKKAGILGQLFGRISLAQQPAPEASNWRVLPGKQSLAELLAGLDEALVVEGVLGLGQSSSIAGDFSNAVDPGYLVRRGEVIGRVKNTMIAGNSYDLLKDHLAGLSDRTEQVLAFLQTPAVVLSDVSVTA